MLDVSENLKLLVPALKCVGLILNPQNFMIERGLK